MSHALRKALTAGVLAGGIVVALAGASFADPGTTASTTATTSAPQSSTPTAASNPLCTPATFSAAQQLVETALANRVTQLNNLTTRADNTANHLTGPDRQTLQGDLGPELSGIQALQPQAQSAIDCRQLRLVAHDMVFDFRVYVVMTPQTHLTITADDETYVETVFTDLETTISGSISAAEAQGRDVTAAQSALNDLEAQVTAAQSETSGLSATLLAQAPSGYPGNWQVFLSARTSETNARNLLEVAYDDLQKIVQDLG
jgi:hypothetical protein